MFSRSKFRLFALDGLATGPGLLSTPARRSSSVTRMVLDDRRLRGVKILETSGTNSSRRSISVSNDGDTVIGASHSCVTVVDSTVVVVETGSHAREQSPNNTTAVVEDMAFTRTNDYIKTIIGKHKTVPMFQ